MRRIATHVAMRQIRLQLAGAGLEPGDFAFERDLTRNSVAGRESRAAIDMTLPKVFDGSGKSNGVLETQHDYRNA